LAAGDPPLMSIGQVVQAGLAGFDLVLMPGWKFITIRQFFAQPGITRLEQLKGKRIGISGYGARPTSRRSSSRSISSSIPTRIFN